MEPLYYDVSIGELPTGDLVYYLSYDQDGKIKGSHCPVVEIKAGQAIILSIYTPGHPFYLSPQVEDEDSQGHGIEEGMMTITYDQVKLYGRVYYKSTKNSEMGNIILAR